MPDAHAALRRGTRAEHDRVDAAFGRLDLADEADYARFLQAQARAHLPVEEELDRTALASVVPDWSAHLRGHALHADLEALGLPLPPPLPAPPLPGLAEALGAFYVLEGSRLGGALLARSIRPGYPHAFLTAPGVKWRKSVELLNKQLYDGSELERALGAARAVFGLFACAAEERVS